MIPRFPRKARSQKMTDKLEDFFEIRAWHAVVNETHAVGGKRLDTPLLKAAVGAVVKNPFAGKNFQQDLSSLTNPSNLLGDEIGRRAVALLGGRSVEGYGKGGIVGLDGEQEHAVACITTIFGDAFRNQVGGGRAWISSASKIGSAGTAMDIPLAYKDEVYVRSHYDAIEFCIPDAPRADEFVICVAVSSGPRPFHRVGGLTAQEVQETISRESDPSNKGA